MISDQMTAVSSEQLLTAHPTTMRRGVRVIWFVLRSVNNSRLQLVMAVNRPLVL